MQWGGDGEQKCQAFARVLKLLIGFRAREVVDFRPHCHMYILQIIAGQKYILRVT